MIALALVPLAASIVLALCGPSLGRVLSGRAAAVLLTGVALACALSTGLVLSAFGVYALAQWQPLALIGHWSVSGLLAHEPLPRPVAIGCGLLALALLGASVGQAALSARRIGASAALCRRLGTTHTGGLVVLDADAPQAFALAGLPGRTVVTRGMLRTLSAPERRALLAHENAHVGHHHFAYLTLARLAATANPLLVRLVPVIRLAVERWADDEAAAQVADRQLVARTLARASLAGAGAGLPRNSLAVAGSDVGRRIEALLDGPSGRWTRLGATLALLAAAACCVVSSGLVGADLHHLVEWAQLQWAPTFAHGHH